MGRCFIKGDYHGQFGGLTDFCNRAQTTTDDILIVLGDFGINYDMNTNELYLKKSLAKKPITLIGVHGNHEERPCFVRGYHLIDSPFGAGQVWHNQQFPNQYFFNDGEYTINNKTILVIGGAYSVDKNYRLNNNLKWFPSEQISEEMKVKLIQETHNKYYDYVFTHTCPTNYIPQDMFLSMIDQHTVDRTTENFLQAIHDQITFEKWYCGHWHTDRIRDKLRFVYRDYIELGNYY